MFAPGSIIVSARDLGARAFVEQSYDFNAFKFKKGTKLLVIATYETHRRSSWTLSWHLVMVGDKLFG